MQLTTQQHEVLVHALARMDDPSKNTTDECARDADDIFVDEIGSDRAVKFCALGHIQRSVFELFGHDHSSKDHYHESVKLAHPVGSAVRELIRRHFTSGEIRLDDPITYVNDTFGTSDLRDLVRAHLAEIVVVDEVAD